MSPTTHHLSVLPNAAHVLLVPLALLLLFNAGNDPPRGTASTNDVLVRNRQEVPLLHRQFLIMHQFGHLLHLVHHFIVPLCLLGQLGHVDTLFAIDALRHGCCYQRKWEFACTILKNNAP